MNDHSTFEEMLARWEELTVPEESILLEHLHSCSICRQEAMVYAEQDSLLRAHAEAEPTNELLRTVKTGVRRAISSRETRATPSHHRTLWLLPAAAVLTVATVLAAHSYLPSGHGVVLPNPVSPARPVSHGTSTSKARITQAMIPCAPRPWCVPGVRLQRPDGKAKVDPGHAVRIARRRWPGVHVRKVILARVHSQNTPILNDRLCWVVWASGTLPTAGRGYLAVFVDAQTGRFLLAASARA